MKILVFDNYDSFTYNLVHIIEKLGYDDIDTYRNDKIKLEEIAGYDKILLSPGPGVPSEAGILLPLIKQYAQDKSILGICLGHQAIAEALGGSLINMENVMHGVAAETTILDENDYLFKGLPGRFQAGHYHSWKVDAKSLPNSLQITAIDERNNIMAMSHKQFDLKGLQFHPESILTEHGERMIGNWLER